MKLRLALIGLPLLRKELLEQAARPRTYVLRTGLALLFFMLTWLYLRPFLATVSTDPGEILGHGRNVFSVLVMATFAVIYFFLPPMVAAIFPAERRRGSLDLLWITSLGPLEILLEKFLSRVIPMITLLFIALPLLTLAYTLGGVTTANLWSAFYLLVLTCFQVGAVALIFSTRCPTAARAAIQSYAFLAVFYLVAPLPLGALIEGIGTYFFLCPPAILWEAMSAGKSVERVMVESLPIVITAVVFVAAGRKYLIRNAGRFRLGPPPLPSGFRRRLWAMHARGRHQYLLGMPGDEPVAWRETGRGVFSKHFVRPQVLIAGGTVLLFLPLLILLITPSGAILLLWMAATLVVVRIGVDAFAGERTRQSLDVLLVTPLTGAEIARQKSRVLPRVVRVFVVVFPLLAWFGFAVRGSMYSAHPFAGSMIGGWAYLYITVASTLIYLPMFYYLSLWIGMQVRSPARATVTAIFSIAAWVLIPLLLAEGASWLETAIVSGPGHEPVSRYLNLLSPAHIVHVAERGVVAAGESAWLLAIATFLWHGGVLWRLRSLCFRRADRYLGRAEEPARHPTR